MSLRTLCLCCSLSTILLAAAASAQSGLTSAGAQVLSESPGILPTLAQDQFGSAIAAGDFNGDGVGDLATSIVRPNGSPNGCDADCGGVLVRYGARSQGFHGSVASVFLAGGLPVALGINGTTYGYGRALAAGDFNGDGIDDLVVGVPGWDTTHVLPYGLVEVHYGQMATGFGEVERLRSGLNGLPGTGQVRIAFGGSLTVGNFNGDAYDDLAVGDTSQAVTVVNGGPEGLLPSNGPAEAFHIYQGLQGLPGSPEAGDQFGSPLAAGDFNHDAYDDLAIGAPGDESVGTVLVIFGSEFSLFFATNQWFSADEVGSAAQAGARFGEALAAGDFDGDSFDDLAIGVPRQDLVVTFVGPAEDSGVVNVIYGYPLGLNLARAQFWTQSIGCAPFFCLVDGRNEAFDLFGSALTAGDFDSDGRDDLAIGHYLEDSAAGFGSGAVSVIMGAPGLGLDDARAGTIVQGAAGFPGGPPQDGRFFGFALAAGDFDADGSADLAIGAPKEDVGALINLGAEMILYGSSVLLSDGFETGLSRWSGVTP